MIADDYARTRAFIPDDIRSLGKYVFPGEKILDLGCANGRFYEVLEDKNTDYYGVDNCEKLIEIAKRKYPKAKFQLLDEVSPLQGLPSSPSFAAARLAEAINLPFPNNFFDKVYCISVFHHIPSPELRIKFLEEVKRVLKPEGLLVLRVWDFWKRKIGFKLLLKFSFLKIIGASKLDFFDAFIPWKDQKGKVLIQRYFHLFTKKELENLVKIVSFKIKNSWRSGEDPRTNIYIITEKT